MQPNFYFENKLGTQVIGVDEAGRGPLVGPVVAAAVLLPRNEQFIAVNDSKKLTRNKREKLYELIVKNAKFSTGIVSHQEIDELNILQASLLAMRKAIIALNVEYDAVIVDGNFSPLPDDKRVHYIIKGDQQSLSIAAASIVAKVTRDKLMQEYSELYPEYGWHQNAGYGTKFHYEQIKKYGITPLHRHSFMKKFFESTKK